MPDEVHKPIKTVGIYSRTVLHIKKSKFITSVCPIFSVNEAKSFWH
jgi:putative IMPACT (imprinted ancient) family translation regulator